MKFGLRLGIAAALAAAATLGTAGGAHAARGLEVGLQDDAVFLYQQYYNREYALQQAKQLGVTRIRVNVLWNRVVGDAFNRHRPARPAYNWYLYDSIVEAAARYGIRVQMTVAGPAPAWATRNHKVGPYRPNARAFGRFVRDVAVHFKGRVDRYSIWNEPNWPGWLAPQRTAPVQYAHLYRDGYKAVKSVDRHAQVLFGELAPQERPHKSLAPLTFVRRAASHGHFLADGFAHHPYAFTVAPTSRHGGRNDVTMGTLGRLTHVLRRLAHRHRLRTSHGRALPLYLTEYGYFARGPRSVGEGRRAAYLRKGFDMALANRHVREMTQYTLVAPPGDVPWDTSLVGPNGSPSVSFNTLSSWALGAIGAGRVAAAPVAG